MNKLIVTNLEAEQVKTEVSGYDYTDNVRDLAFEKGARS